MTTSSTPDRGRQSPSVAEIAALTRRLRDLSARGRDADPGERTGFLADKRALLGRITGPGPRVAGPEPGPSRADAEVEFGRREAEHWERYGDHDPDPWADHIAPSPSWRAVDGDAQVVATFNPADAYSDTQIAEIATARAAGDTDRAEQLQAAAWPLQDTAREPVAQDNAAGGRVPQMPEWMREQARIAEVEIAAGTAEPVRPDDPAEIAARIDALRNRADATRTEAPASRAGEPDEAERRAQLAAWHADDLPSDEMHLICGPDPVREW